MFYLSGKLSSGGIFQQQLQSEQRSSLCFVSEPLTAQGATACCSRSVSFTPLQVGRTEVLPTQAQRDINSLRMSFALVQLWCGGTALSLPETQSLLFWSQTWILLGQQSAQFKGHRSQLFFIMWLGSDQGNDTSRKLWVSGNSHFYNGTMADGCCHIRPGVTLHRDHLPRRTDTVLPHHPRLPLSYCLCEAIINLHV